MDFTLLQVVIIWVIFFGLIFLLFKDRWVKKRLESNKSRLLNYYILLTPLVLIEEFLTCEIPLIPCLKITLPAFFLFFFILYLIQTRLKLGWKKTSVIFGLIGWVNEFIFVGRMFGLTTEQTLFLTPFTILIYGVLAIIPSYYVYKTFKK